jgi:hypothetical protein
MSMASWPSVRKARSSGSPMTRDLTGSAMCSAGIHWRAPISACPVPLPHVGQVHGVDAVGHLPRASQVLAFDPASGLVGLFLTGLIDRPDHQAAAAPAAPGCFLQPGHRKPAHHGHRGEGIPARVVQQPLRGSGVRSPPRRAMLHPFTRGSSPTSADTYLPACSHGSVRAKHGRSRPRSSSRFRSASPAPMLTGAAASVLVLVTQT